ncbi:MAG: hypothetical protein DHS20C05_02380 [Hyphococcus sp.]|nr:MAG: hypothetical protein DHS20C05_02380 [Marinicaulis sp.]
MLKFFAERGLKDFSDRYDYDVSYMRHMLEISPAAFLKFSKLTELAQHCDAAPVDALFAAKLVGAVTEDCGPCVQLVVNMAREAGVEPAQIEAILKRDHNGMNADAALGFCFADAIVRRAPFEDEVRNDVRASWGEAGIIDLTMAVQIGRVFPMVKAGMGFAKECRRVTIDDTPIDVIKGETVKDAA